MKVILQKNQVMSKDTFKYCVKCQVFVCQYSILDGISWDLSIIGKSIEMFDILIDKINISSFNITYQTPQNIVHYVHFIFVKYTVPIFTHTWRFKWTASWVFFYLTNFWVKPLDIVLIMNIKKKDYYNGFSSFGLFGAFYRVKCSRKQKYSTRCQYNFNF